MYNNPNIMNTMPIQNNYIDELLRNNIGKKMEVHASFTDSIEWRDSIFNGILESVGKDYIIIKMDQKSYIIWSIYIDYIIVNNNR